MDDRNQNKGKIKHVTFKLSTRSIVRFSPQTTQWYHYRMTSLSNVRVKWKISCQWYINVCLIMMSNHGANPVFSNKKNKDWTSKTLSTPPSPSPPTSDNISFLPYPPSPQSGCHTCICHSKIWITKMYQSQSYTTWSLKNLQIYSVREFPSC